MIKIYSTSWCGPCQSAKRLLDQLNQPYQEIDIEEHRISRQDLKNLTGGSTVPQIIINGNSIGGFDSLVKMNQNGTLKEMLK
tara:strand:- start:263 stop:508 length:246 start_codon:yes stop_codon:yes gene_type:complete